MDPFPRRLGSTKREFDSRGSDPRGTGRQLLDDLACGAQGCLRLADSEREVRAQPAAESTPWIYTEPLRDQPRIDHEPLAIGEQAAGFALGEGRSKRAVHRGDRVSVPGAQARKDTFDSNRIHGLRPVVPQQSELRSSLVELAEPERLAGSGARNVRPLEQSEL